MHLQNVKTYDNMFGRTNGQKYFFLNSIALCVHCMLMRDKKCGVVCTTPYSVAGRISKTTSTRHFCSIVSHDLIITLTTTATRTDGPRKHTAHLTDEAHNQRLDLAKLAPIAFAWQHSASNSIRIRNDNPYISRRNPHTCS